MAFKSINPATGEIVATHGEISAKAAEEIISDSHAEFLNWRSATLEKRGEVLNKIGKLLEERKAVLAQMMTREIGKPIGQSIGEVEKCAWVCRYFAENAGNHLKDQTVNADLKKSYVTFEPLGPILGIMPWNFPFWQVFRFAAPTLMAGNTVLIKHAPNVLGCAFAMEEIFKKVGHKNLFRILPIKEKIVAGIIKSPFVRAVTLTGSIRAGRIVAAQAGAALKKSVMELGGSDPYIILEDADLEMASEVCVNFRIMNSGQVCISPKRLIVIDHVYNKFEGLVLEKTGQKKMGDPMDPKIDIGPMARRDLRKTLHGQIIKSKELGAKILLGGKIPKGIGWFYPPTVLTRISSKMPVYKEEVFGPVVTLIRAKDLKEAIDIANDTKFGLGAGVFTNDMALGEKIARNSLCAGNCTVNMMVKSDPRFPFGGIKGSGYGRELGTFGIQEFVNIKTVMVQ